MALGSKGEAAGIQTQREKGERHASCRFSNQGRTHRCPAETVLTEMAAQKVPIPRDREGMA
jgi:hypothetical protein